MKQYFIIENIYNEVLCKKIYFPNPYSFFYWSRLNSDNVIKFNSKSYATEWLADEWLAENYTFYLRIKTMYVYPQSAKILR